MRFEKLTIKSQEALSEAQSQATARGHSLVEPTHLLGALLTQPEGSTLPVLQKLGVALDPLQLAVADILARTPKVSGGAAPNLSPATSRILDAALGEAEAMKDEYVSTEHLLLAIATDSKDPAGRSLREAGASRDAILKALAAVRGGVRGVHVARVVVRPESEVDRRVRVGSVQATDEKSIEMALGEVVDVCREHDPAPIE